MSKLRYTITLQFDCVTSNPQTAESTAAYTANQLNRRDGYNARILAIHSSGIASIKPAVLVSGTDFESVETKAQ